MLGVDYAGGRPGGAALKAQGYDFACRYLSSGGPGLPGKLLLPNEANDLRAAGVDVVSNFESTATTMLGGAAQGAADAQQAQASKARIQSLANSFHLIDVQSVYRRPLDLIYLDDLISLESGLTTPTTLNNNAEVFKWINLNELTIEMLSLSIDKIVVQKIMESSKN